MTLRTWRRDPIAFIEQVLHDPETGKPFVLLDAEREFLKHAFTLADDGRLRYPEQIFAAPKKSGKTTLAAITTIAVVLLFGGRYAEAYCVANDLEQAQSRVFEMIRRIVEASPLLRGEAKVTADRITFHATSATITALASDYASAAGGHPTISVFDELWGYTSERSRRLWDEMIPVPTRTISCRLVVSYAGFEGESELLHELHKRGMAQPEVAPSLRAGDGMLMAWHHEPIAPWQSEAWLAEMRRSLRPNQFLRMIENRFVTSEESFVELGWWDACVDPQSKPLVVDRELQIFVGIDASLKRDSTAIVATAWDRKLQRVRLVQHRIFQPTPDDPIDFEAAVEETILALSRRFQICKVWYDPYQMQASAQRLLKDGIKIEEFPQSSPNLTEASQHLYELIKGRNLSVYPDAAIRLAISRAVAVETARGWRISKDKQSHKIDVVVALAMAALCAVKAQGETSFDTTYSWVDGEPDGLTDAERWRQRHFDRVMAHIRASVR
jgi:phage terminase large subunit-like protein